jgi:predicted nucleic acid-binding protein
VKKPKIYIETSIVSYLTARPSRDIIAQSHQQITREWWDSRRQEFDVYISLLVRQEAERGDGEAAQRRLAHLTDIPELSITDDVLTLTAALLEAKALPQKAVDDAVHIAIAAVHNVDFLLTWNFKHIANATKLAEIEQIIRSMYRKVPQICTPEFLFGE